MQPSDNAAGYATIATQHSAIAARQLNMLAECAAPWFSVITAANAEHTAVVSSVSVAVFAIIAATDSVTQHAAIAASIHGCGGWFSVIAAAIASEHASVIATISAAVFAIIAVTDSSM